MDQHKPAPATKDTFNPIESLTNTGYEDWIDKYELIKDFNISSRTADYYIEKGILQHPNLA